MRVNLNPSTSIFQHNHRNSSEHNWLDKLQNEWLIAYDIRADVPTSYSLLYSLEGARLFCKWLENEGFKVKFWEFNMPNESITIAYGIEFIDSCEKFIELKLKTL